MGGAPLLCLFEKETGYRLNLRSVYMDRTNSVGGSNSSRGKGSVQMGLNDLGIPVMGPRILEILKTTLSKLRNFLSSAAPPDS